MVQLYFFASTRIPARDYATWIKDSVSAKGLRREHIQQQRNSKGERENDQSKILYFATSGGDWSLGVDFFDGLSNPSMIWRSTEGFTMKFR